MLFFYYQTMIKECKYIPSSLLKLFTYIKGIIDYK